MGEVALTTRSQNSLPAAREEGTRIAGEGRASALRGILGLTILLAAVILLAVGIGATHVSWRALIDGDSIARAIILRIRLPRVIVGALVGATLAISGVTFQTLLRNPLADPFILGVSGGAACGAAVSSAFGLGRYPGVVPVLAFAGALGATAAVFLLARRRDRTYPTTPLRSGRVL